MIAKGIAMRRLPRVYIRAVAFALPVAAIANLRLEASPLCLLGVLVFLSRVAMIAAWPPFTISGLSLPFTTMFTDGFLVRGLRTVWPRALPSPLTSPEAFGARGLTRVPQFSSFEPPHHR
jgi:hypothetical protein